MMLYQITVDYPQKTNVRVLVPTSWLTQISIVSCPQLEKSVGLRLPYTKWIDKTRLDRLVWIPEMVWRVPKLHHSNISDSLAEVTQSIISEMDSALKLVNLSTFLRNSQSTRSYTFSRSIFRINPPSSALFTPKCMDHFLYHSDIVSSRSTWNETRLI